MRLRRAESLQIIPNPEKTKEKLMKTLCNIVFMLLVMLIVAACSSQEKPTLKIGMNAEFPPFSYKVDGSFVGIDVDLAHKIAEKMDQPYEIVDMEFENLIPAITAGRIDFAISALSITEERSRLIEFSQEYFRVNQAVYAKQNSPIEIQSPRDMAQYRIGVTNSTTAHQWVQQNLVLKNLVSIAQIHLYLTHTEAFTDLMKDNIDLVINDDSVFYGFKKKFPITIKYLIDTGEAYGIAMPKDGEYNKKIKAALQDIIDSGEMQSIIQTHIPKQEDF